MSDEDDDDFEAAEAADNGIDDGAGAQSDSGGRAGDAGHSNAAALTGQLQGTQLEDDFDTDMEV